MPVVEASHLTKRYGSVEALKEVDVSVDRGEFFGIALVLGILAATTYMLLKGIDAKWRGTEFGD